MADDKSENWKQKLPKDVYHVTREKGTEPPFSGKLLNNKKNGKYTCSNCGQELFSADKKYDSGTGWPSFTDAKAGAVEYVKDNSHGMTRTEVVCSKCKAHLGHVFDDGPGPTCQRFCMNSLSLSFKDEDGEKEQKNKE